MFMKQSQIERFYTRANGLSLEVRIGPERTPTPPKGFTPDFLTEQTPERAMWSIRFLELVFPALTAHG